MIRFRKVSVKQESKMPRKDEIHSYDEDSEILEGLEKAASGRLPDRPRRRVDVASIKRSASDFVRMAEDKGLAPAISADFGGEPVMAGNVAPGTIIKTDTGEKAGVVTKDDGMGTATVKQEDGTEVEMDSQAIQDKQRGITSGYSFGDEIYIGEPSETDSWSKPFIGTVMGRKTVSGAYTLIVEAANGKTFDIPEERIGKKVEKKAAIEKKALEPSIQQDTQSSPQQANENDPSNKPIDGGQGGENMQSEEEEQKINMDNPQQDTSGDRPGEYGNIYQKYLQDMLTKPDVAVSIVQKMLEDGKAKPEMIVRLDSYIPEDGNIDESWVKKNGMTLLDDFVRLTGVNNLNKLSSFFPKKADFGSTDEGMRSRCKNCGRPLYLDEGELCQDCVTGMEDNLESPHEDLGDLGDFSFEG
jgi:hypothetical protein